MIKTIEQSLISVQFPSPKTRAEWVQEWGVILICIPHYCSNLKFFKFSNLCLQILQWNINECYKLNLAFAKTQQSQGSVQLPQNTC